MAPAPARLMARFAVGQSLRCCCADCLVRHGAQLTTEGERYFICALLAIALLVVMRVGRTDEWMQPSRWRVLISCPRHLNRPGPVPRPTSAGQPLSLHDDQRVRLKSKHRPRGFSITLAARFLLPHPTPPPPLHLSFFPSPSFYI